MWYTFRHVLVFSLVSFSSLFCLSWHKKYRYYCTGYRARAWNQSVTVTDQEREWQKKLFGYDLGIETVFSRSTKMTLSGKQRIQLFVHGYAQNKNQAFVFADYCQLLTGHFATFNLPDHISFVPPLVPRFLRSSFGQLRDIMPTLYVINFLKQKLHLEALDLYGFSRGGAVLINMLAVLSDQSGCYDEELTRIGINLQDKQEIIQLIQRGSVVLHAPLIDTSHVLTQRWYGIPHQLFSRLSYDPHGLVPLASLDTITLEGLKILLHFQHNDESVLNTSDALTYRKCSSIPLLHDCHVLSPEVSSAVYLVLGNDGGHNCFPKALKEVIHSFYLIVGASYNKHEQKRITRHGTGLMQPSVDEAEHVINTFYRSCDRHKK